MSLTFFIQPEILNRIGTVRIARFFQDFTEDLKAAGLVPPDAPDPESATDNYINSAAALFASLVQGWIFAAWFVTG